MSATGAATCAPPLILALPNITDVADIRRSDAHGGLHRLGLIGGTAMPLMEWRKVGFSP